jgi:hypothetical protein
MLQQCSWLYFIVSNLTVLFIKTICCHSNPILKYTCYLESSYFSKDIFWWWSGRCTTSSFSSHKYELIFFIFGQVLERSGGCVSLNSPQQKWLCSFPWMDILFIFFTDVNVYSEIKILFLYVLENISCASHPPIVTYFFK